MDFSECKNPEYDFPWKGSKTMGPVETEIRASKAKFVGLFMLTVESDTNDLRC